MATKNEIAVKVLQKLYQLEAGGTALTADTDLIEDVYDSVYAALKAEDLVSWGSGDDIPTAAVIPIVGLVALECKEEFNAPAVTVQSLMANEERYKDKLKALEYNYYVPDTKFEYY